MSAGPFATPGDALPSLGPLPRLFGSDGTNIAPGVTLFDGNGVAISAANPLQAQSEPRGYTAYNTAANTAGFQVKNGTGIFHGITINTGGVTSSATFYDGTSTAGTKLATVSTLAIGSLFYDIELATGLFVVLAGGTPADVTITYL